MNPQDPRLDNPRRDPVDPEFGPLPPEARPPEYDGVSTNVSAVVLVAIIVVGGLFAFYYYGTSDNVDRTPTGSTKTEQSMPSGQAPVGTPPDSSLPRKNQGGAGPAN